MCTQQSLCNENETHAQSKSTCIELKIEENVNLHKQIILGNIGKLKYLKTQLDKKWQGHIMEKITVLLR